MPSEGLWLPPGIARPGPTQPPLAPRPVPPRFPSGSGPSSPTQPLVPGLRLAQMLTLTDQTDVRGRLILEDSAPKRAVKNAKRAGIHMKTAPAAYPDTPSRVGGLMNVSAYDALRHDLADVLNGFAWLTSRYLALYPDRRGTVRMLFDIGYVGVTLPLFLFHRRPDPIDQYGALPSYVASLCKAARGVVSAAVDLMNQSDSPEQKVTAAEVVAFADQRGHLRRPNTERACAAPTRLIERTISVMLTSEGGDATKSGLGELVDFDTLWAFCQVQDEFSRALNQYKALLDQLADSGAGDDPNLLFSAKVEINGRTQSFGALSESMLRYAQGVQAQLNAILGRGDSSATISYEELLRML